MGRLDGEQVIRAVHVVVDGEDRLKTSSVIGNETNVSKLEWEEIFRRCFDGSNLRVTQVN